MERQLALRKIAPAALNFAQLSQVTGPDLDASPQSETIPGRPDEADSQVLIPVGTLIPENGGTGVNVDESQVRPPIAVEVGAGRSPAGLLVFETQETGWS